MNYDFQNYYERSILYRLNGELEVKSLFRLVDPFRQE